MATLQNERDKTLQATNPRLIATTVVISSSAGSQFVKPNAVDPIAPTSLTLTGVTIVFTSATIKWYYASNADMVWHDFNISGSNIGPTRALSSADFVTQLGAEGTKVFYKATAEQFGYASSTSPVFEISYSDLSGGEDGIDAYHIRLDNESRIVLFDYTEEAVAGQLPLTALTYVTKGPVDITSGTGYVTYAINSTLGATGCSVTSSGVVTVTNITLDVNYVEIRATVSAPGLPVMTLDKKLYIYKQIQPSLEVDVDVTQDHVYYEYANSTSTTNIAAWSTITMSAVVKGYPGAIVTWSAKVYNSAGTEISGTETIFTATGNTCTVTAAQFVLRGGNLAARMDVTASYTVGGTTVKDVVAILRKDGTNGTRFLYANNIFMTFAADKDGVISATKLAEEFSDLQVINLATGTAVDDSIGWEYTATFPSGLAGAINGSNPYTATVQPIRLLLSAITVNAGETVEKEILLVATKSGFPSVSRSITVRITAPISDGYELVVDPDKLITLPVDVNNNIISYSSAYRDVWVRKGTADDSANWTFSITNGPGITASLTGDRVSVTNFISVKSSLQFPTAPTNNALYYTAGSRVAGGLCHNGSNTLMYVITDDSTYVKCVYSNDYGTTWTTSDIPRPGGWQLLNLPMSISGGVLTYMPSTGKFVLLYATPTGGGNGRVYHSADGVTWTGSTLPNLPGGAWNNIFVDKGTGTLYIYSDDGYYTASTTNLTSWAFNTATDVFIPESAVMGGYGGNFYKFRNLYGTIYRSNNLTSWTTLSNYLTTVPGSGAAGLTTTKNGTAILSGNGTGTGIFVFKAGSSPPILFKNIGASQCAPYSFSAEDEIFVTNSQSISSTFDNFNTIGSVTVYPIGGATIPNVNPVAAATLYNYLTGNLVWTTKGEELPKDASNNYYFPIVYLNYPSAGGVSYYWKALLQKGNNGSESYVTVTATPSNAELSPISTRIIVKRGTFVSDLYTLSVNPGTILLPSTSDGKVYPSSYTNNTNVSNYRVLKNGAEYTGGVTGSITTSTGVTATTSGSATGTVTVTNLADANDTGTISGILYITGTSETLKIDVNVAKLKDGTTSGVKYGTSVSAFTSNQTAIYIRFNPSGTVELKKGAGGSYVYAVDWFSPVNAVSPPGSNYWIKMSYTSDTSDVLVNGTGGTLGTWSQLNTSREWYISNAATGTHRVTLRVLIGDSSTGNNAVIGTGVLELEVP